MADISKIKVGDTEYNIKDSVARAGIPTNTSDLNNDSGFIDNTVNNLTNYTLSTNVGAKISVQIDSSTYVMTFELQNANGERLGDAQTVDLPLETMVVGASYDSVTKEIVLMLKNGQTLRFSVADLVSGLQTEITTTNKLSSDLVDDTDKTNKFVTAAEKSTWNGKQDAINDLSTIRENASAGASASSTISGYGDVVTHDASEFATSTQGGKADTAVQPSDLSTVATSGDYNDLLNKPTIPDVTTKADKVAIATNGNFAGLDANGNLTDSGSKASDFLTQHQDISGKEDITNKTTAITSENKSSTTLYPNLKAVADYVDAQVSSSITTALGGSY